MVQAMLDVEAALALAQADCGLLPQEAAESISAVCKTAIIKPAALSAGMAQDGVPVAALVAEIRKHLQDDHAHFVHWGATSQDIMDTGLVLRLRPILAQQEDALLGLADQLAELADTHRATPMAARTRMQQAAPTCFGLKAAIWLSGLLRHLQRLTALRERLLVLSFAGAAGTLSALGQKALDVEACLARRLSLGLPPAPWHTMRDSLHDYANWLSLLSGSLGKIALDIVLMCQSEVAEIKLAQGGGSSTMPNKSNPVGAELIIALARQNAGLLAALHQSALHEHERSGSSWALEWMTLPQMVVGTSTALSHAGRLVGNMTIDSGRMLQNLEASNGLMLAEAASFALSAHMPRPEAQTLVKTACKRAVTEHHHLFDVLSKLVKAPVDWEALKDPALHMGISHDLIDRVLESDRKSSCRERV